MFLEELADLKDRYPDRFRLVHVLSRETQEAELLSGRLDPPRLRRLLAACCRRRRSTSGSSAGRSRCRGCRECSPRPASVRSRAHRAVPRRGRGTARVRLARGGPGGRVEQRAGDARRPCVDRPGAAYRRRILDAVLAVRADAPYACKGGVCGTCRARP
jgi:ring-1,2-phenylacetyl-CoA epoxidase subunit PaaE